MKNLLARGAGLAAVAALVASAGSVPAQAAPIAVPAGVDRSPVAQGAAYLAAQRGANGIITSYFQGSGSEDVGLTIDAATSLDAVGGQAAAVAAMRDGVTAPGVIDSYTQAPAFGTDVYANSVAKVGAFALAMGANPADFGGENLVAQLEALVDGDGRIADDPAATGPAPNYASPLGQAYATQVLYTRSAKADAVLTDLKKQQCSGNDKGFFRADFAAAVCANDATAVPSVDTTAFAILALQSQKGRVLGTGQNAISVDEMINKAVQWLTQTQAADGSFKSTAGAVNANSTGLAGWALGVSGIRPNAAERAASWLRGHQLANAGACAPFAPGVNGAVVVDDLGLANATAGPLDLDQQSTATRATAQALPGLVYAAGGAGAGDVKLSAPTGFVSSSAPQTLTIAGAPGDTVCIVAGSTATRVVLNGNGAGTVPVTLPAVTGPYAVSSTDAGGEADAATFNVLAPAKLSVDLKRNKIRRGQKAVVKVTGLAQGEKVTATYKGKTVSGTANASGKAKLRFKANKAGKAKVKVVGQFANRTGKAKLRVIARR